MVIICLKHTVFALCAWDGQTDGLRHCLMPLHLRWWGHTNPCLSRCKVITLEMVIDLSCVGWHWSTTATMLWALMMRSHSLCRLQPSQLTSTSMTLSVRPLSVISLFLSAVFQLVQLLHAIASCVSYVFPRICFCQIQEICHSLRKNWKTTTEKLRERVVS